MRKRDQKIEAATALLALALGVGLGTLFGSFLVGFGVLTVAGLCVLAVLAIVRRQSSGGRGSRHRQAHAGPRV